MATHRLTLPKVLPFVLIIGGIVGFMASFLLSIDKFKLLQNPGFHPLCSINPVISCTSVAGTPQAAVFGFPNMFLGIAGFAMIITVGVAMLAGATFKPWFWRLLNLGALCGVVFIHWLFFQSVYRIGALCIYCMITWSVTMPIFWYVSLYNLREGTIVLPKLLARPKEFAHQHHGDVLGAWYLVLFFLILKRFWYYFGPLLHLS
ncbi:MAG TPA: vitamin K epoxide reductase family protein [Candidatus Saccharimonadales bacterium]|nr:vitamin K epoxide reductase family protein [Candidatus Saccharimonadales bacterium]